MVMLVGLVVSSMVASCDANFFQEFDLTWGGNRAKIFNGGQLLSLSLDKTSGSGFQSKKEFLFGRIDMQLKLVAGNSAGTVTAYYVCILQNSSISFLSFILFSLLLYFVCKQTAALVFHWRIYEFFFCFPKIWSLIVNFLFGLHFRHLVEKKRIMEDTSVWSIFSNFYCAFTRVAIVANPREQVRLQCLPC